MEFPVEATLNMKAFQDKNEVLSLLKSHGFELKWMSEDTVRVKGNFMELRVVKLHLEKLMVTVPHQSSPSMKESASGLASSLDREETSPPDKHESVRSRDEKIVVDRDVFRYAEKFRKEELNEALKGPVRMHQLETRDSITITLSGKNSMEAGSKLKHLLANLNKFLRTQDVLLSNLSSKGVHLLQKIEKSGNIFGPNLVLLIDDRVHIIGPSKESFELKQELLVDKKEHNGKSSERHGRKTKSVSLRNLLKKKSRKGVQEVFSPAAGEAAVPAKVPAEVPAGRRRGTSLRDPRSSKTREKKRAKRSEHREEEFASPKQRKNLFDRFLSLFRKS